MVPSSRRAGIGSAMFRRFAVHQQFRSLGIVVAVTALGCVIGQVCGCASSRLATTWHTTQYTASPLAAILVISVGKNPVQRRIWEDAFANELAQHGVAATSSHRLFPAAPPDTHQVIAAVHESGFDGILAILRLPTERNKRYNRGYTSIDQDELKGSYWQRYRTYYSETEHPAYIDSQKVDIRAIDVTATANGGQLIWSTMSRTTDPDSVIDVQQVIASLVVSELVRQSIIGSGK